MNALLNMDYSVTQQSHQGGRDYNEDRTAIFEKDGTVFLVPVSYTHLTLPTIYSV